MKEEINFDMDFDPIITHYYDEIKEQEDEIVHNIEIDFIIDVHKEDIKVKLGREHCDYKWVTKDDECLDEFIREKLSNI